MTLALIDIIGKVGRSHPARPLGLVMMPFVRRMRLGTLARLSGRRICIPSAGYPAIALSGTSVAENLRDGALMYATLAEAITRFGLEADGTVSDLTIEPEACGCQVALYDDNTPHVTDHPFTARTDLSSLEVPEPLMQPRMRAMINAVSLLSKRFALPTVTGGSGPFTLAAELLGASEAAMFTITEKDFMHRLLRYCTEVSRRYLLALKAAGADVILIGEPTASILSPASYREFSAGYTAELIGSVGCPTILHICGDATHLLQPMCETGAQGLSLDSAVDLPQAALTVDKNVVLIGNLDTVSVLLEATPEVVREKTAELLESMRPFPNYVVSSGCDLSYATPVENIVAMLETVREFR
jgi:uroporphyrinogen decarboxylase